MSRTVNPYSLLLRGVAIELVRQKDFYVLGILVLTFGFGALGAKVVGETTDAAATFLLNMGLTLASLCAHVLTLLMAARQIPREMQHRTIYPILARPINRAQYIVGKWLATSACGVFAFLVFFLFVLVTTPSREATSNALLVQLLFLQLASLGLAAASAIQLSLLWPTPVVLTVLGAWILAGHTLITLLRSAFGNAVFTWLVAYIPDFSKFNLVTRYTDGIPALPLATFVGLVVYAIMFIAFALWTSHLVFRRRQL